MKEEQSDSEEENEQYQDSEDLLSEQEEMRDKKSNKRLKLTKLSKRQKLSKRANPFIDDEASEDNDEDVTHLDGRKKEDQYYSAKDLAPSRHKLDLKAMEKKFLKR